jgi:NADPH:quinone reductase-like Zn-dependent oxidoreductase
MAHREGRERSTMEAAGQRSGDAHRKAAVYTRYGPPDVVQITDIEKPVPKDNEVLTKVHAASVNPSDWHCLRGKPHFLVWLAFETVLL